MLPEGWESRRLGDMLEKIFDYRGKSVPKSDNGIPLITAKNVRQGYLDFTEREYIGSDEYDAWMTRGVPGSKDILFTTEAPLGYACMYPEDGKFAVGQRTITLRVKVSVIDPKYLLYFILSKYGQRLIHKRASGSTAKGIKSSELKKVVIICPPIEEQTKIARILSAWDRAIGTTGKLIESSRQQKHALMQQLLTGKGRLLGFKDKWSLIEVAKMGKIYSGGTPDTNNASFWGGDIPWATPTDITQLHSKFIDSTAKCLTAEGVKNSAAKPMPPNSLLVCTRATIGFMAISEKVMCTNQGFKNLVPNDNFDINFLYFLFAFNRKLLVKYACGSTFSELSGRDFKRLKFMVPSKKEQIAIAEVLLKIDQVIEQYEGLKDNLADQKRALMQQLLTGKLRVKVDE
ncbi:MAG: restriction endonuclease subunit S [Desulfarculaceae bacterium]|nr:restriction endonuclease subunit S [Desulfarculaceae bacterium]